jgi:ABC-type glycerol-3-phosphate transport system substrate-binding protein
MSGAPVLRFKRNFSGGRSACPVKRLVLIAAILSLILAACGGDGGDSGGAKTPTGPVSITFWHSETASAKDNLVKLVDRFNASQNEV